MKAGLVSELDVAGRPFARNASRCGSKLFGRSFSRSASTAFRPTMIILHCLLFDKYKLEKKPDGSLVVKMTICQNDNSMATKRQPTTGLATFDHLAKLAEINDDEKAIIQREGKALARAMVNYGFSKLEIGKRLINLRTVLEPHGLFVRLLQTLHFTPRTAYRYMYGYQNASKILPETVLEEAMARGYRMIGESPATPVGVYTEAVKQLPPPKDPSPAAARKYLDSVEKLRRQYTTEGRHNSVEDAEDVLEECFRFFDSRLRRIAADKKTRTEFLRVLVGMQMFAVEMPKAMKFKPVEVPEGLRVRPGRPKLERG
jgi:hypothetical protein